MRIQPSERTETVEEYYFSSKLKEIEEMRKQGIPVINLGIGSPDLPPPGSVIMRLQTTSGQTDVHGYQPYSGIPLLREAFSKWYLRYYGIRLDPASEILPLTGSKEGIMHISLAFLNPGDKALVPDPGYPAYSAAARLAGAIPVTYDLAPGNNWQPDLNLLRQNDLQGVKLMWVNYPHMPTGASSSAGMFRRLVDFGTRHNILICNDNPYSFILNENRLSILCIPGAEEIAMELNSLSKSHNMAGWRIGMLAGNAGYIKSVLKVKSSMDSGMFLPMQLAAAEALNCDEEWYDKLNREYRERRNKVWRILDITGCEYDRKQSGLFVWARIPEQYDNAEELCDMLLYKAHVFITPGTVFGSNGRNYLRISLCTDLETLGIAEDRIRMVHPEDA